MAAQSNQADVCAALIASGANVNAVTGTGGTGVAGVTPLHVAAQMGYGEVCGVLLGAGAHVNALTSDGATPLYLAADGGEVQVCLTLLAAGANVNLCEKATSVDGQTPLQWLMKGKSVKKLWSAAPLCGLRCPQPSSCLPKPW